MPIELPDQEFTGITITCKANETITANRLVNYTGSTENNQRCNIADDAEVCLGIALNDALAEEDVVILISGTGILEVLGNTDNIVVNNAIRADGGSLGLGIQAVVLATVVATTSLVTPIIGYAMEPSDADNQFIKIQVAPAFAIVAP